MRGAAPSSSTNLGGGTFDVSVVRVEQGVVEVLATAGDNQLGGDDFDALVLERLNAHVETALGIENARDDRLLQARLRRAAERAKIELSDQPCVRVEEDHVATVDGEAMHLTCELTRADFERDLEPFLDRSLQAVTTALQGAGVRPSQLDRVLLVGGSTRIPRVAAVLTERLGQEPHGEVDPDLCVALGAGVQAGIEMGQDMQAVLVDITPYTFGTSAAGELYGMPYAHQFFPLIRRNSKLPATCTDVFFTMFPEQEEAEIKVYQGEEPDALKNVEIGTFLFSGLNRRQGAHAQGLLCTYSLDLDGLLHVHARERATGREIRGVVENAIGRSSDEALGAARERVSALWGEEGDGAEAEVDDAGEAAGGAEPTPGPVAVPPDVAREAGETLARAEQALEAAPAEDPRRDDQPDGGSPGRPQGGRGRAGGRAPARARRDSLLPGIAGLGTLSDLRGPACRRAVLPPLPDGPAAGAGDRTRRGPPPAGGPRRPRSRRLRRGPCPRRPAACALHRSPESLTALALVALADRDFPAAIRLWREVRAGSAPAGRQ